jgi:hypothetical protein
LQEIPNFAIILTYSNKTGIEMKKIVNFKFVDFALLTFCAYGMINYSGLGHFLCTFVFLGYVLGPVIRYYIELMKTKTVIWQAETVCKQAEVELIKLQTEEIARTQQLMNL